MSEKGPSILCIQESKLSQLDELVGSLLWGTSPHGFSFRPSVGASGGLIIFWDSKEVEVWSSFTFDHVFAFGGRFVHSNEDFVLFNINALIEVGAQRLLWDTLLSRLDNYVGKKVCVCVVILMFFVDQRRGGMWRHMLVCWGVLPLIG